MVNYSPDALDAIFAALADPTRRAILAQLARGEASVGELARPFDMSLPAISKHLRVLERARLLSRTREGRVHRCQLEARPLHDAAGWIAFHRRFWEERFAALEAHLKRELEKETRPWRHPSRKPRPPSRSAAASRRRGGSSSGPGRTRKP